MVIKNSDLRREANGRSSLDWWQNRSRKPWLQVSMLEASCMPSVILQSISGCLFQFHGGSIRPIYVEKTKWLERSRPSQRLLGGLVSIARGDFSVRGPMD